MERIGTTPVQPAAGQGVHDLCMAVGFLSHIQAGHGEAKGPGRTAPKPFAPRKQTLSVLHQFEFLVGNLGIPLTCCI